MEKDALRHTGVVAGVENGMAAVRFVRSSMCKHCGACMTAGDSQMEVRVANTLGAAVGDTVEVSLSASSMLTASAWCYLFPLAGLLVGVLAGARISELGALLLGLGLCGLCFLVLYLLDKLVFRRNKRFVPKLVRIVSEETNEQ